MKPFENENNSSANDACAEVLLEVIPLVMCKIRHEVRRQRPLGLSLPQFRTMGYLWRHNGASLSAVADHLGLTPSTASKIIDNLVHQQLVNRETSSQDRRRALLTVTEHGRSILLGAKDVVKHEIAECLTTLSPCDAEEIVRALERLKVVYAPEEGI